MPPGKRESIARKKAEKGEEVEEANGKQRRI
jgi:hypothetical protein